MRGYRGALRQLAHTGSFASLFLQLRTGARHLLRRSVARLRSPSTDPVRLFVERYGPDGFGLPDPEAAALAQAAERCLVCGLCSIECARVGGAPPLDPRDAVVAGARLELEWRRLAERIGASSGPVQAQEGGGCSRCAACEPLCPVAIPIAAIQERLGRFAGPEREPRPAQAEPLSASPAPRGGDPRT